jgi:uncharacterized DUF497 family protein
VNFEWDPGKARPDRRNHGVSFQEAATVFGDALAVTFPDPDHSMISTTFRILIVSHVDRGENLRIISARMTTSRERKYYEE